MIDFKVYFQSRLDYDQVSKTIKTNAMGVVATKDATRITLTSPIDLRIGGRMLMMEQASERKLRRNRMVCTIPRRAHTTSSVASVTVRSSVLTVRSASGSSNSR